LNTTGVSLPATMFNNVTRSSWALNGVLGREPHPTTPKRRVFFQRDAVIAAARIGPQPFGRRARA